MGERLHCPTTRRQLHAITTLCASPAVQLRCRYSTSSSNLQSMYRFYRPQRVRYRRQLVGSSYRQTRAILPDCVSVKPGHERHRALVSIAQRPSNGTVRLELAKQRLHRSVVPMMLSVVVALICLRQRRTCPPRVKPIEFEHRQQTFFLQYLIHGNR